MHHDAPRKLGGAHGDNGYQATSGYWYHVPGQCFACCTEETHVNDHWRKLWPAQRSVYIISKCSPCRGHGCWCLQHNISVGSSWVHAGVNVWPCGCSMRVPDLKLFGLTVATLRLPCYTSASMKGCYLLWKHLKYCAHLAWAVDSMNFSTLNFRTNICIYIDRYIYILYIHIWLYIYDYIYMIIYIYI